MATNPSYIPKLHFLKIWETLSIKNQFFLQMPPLNHKNDNNYVISWYYDIFDNK